MPLYLDPDELHAFRDLNQGPGALLDLIGAMAFRAGGTAQRLGVFDALAAGPDTAHDLARKLDVVERPLAVLLDALVRFGYLERRDGRYALGPAAEGFTTGLALWHDVIGELWTGLEEAVRTGHPPEPYYPWLEQRPGTLRAFHDMLAGMARSMAPAVVHQAPPLGGRLLDVGGGHAIYSIAFCQAVPGLAATVVDLPGALAEGRARVEEAGLGDRITLVPGDLRDAVEGRYDAALLFNVCHGLAPEDAAALVARVTAALEPGGTLLVLEPFADPPPGTRGHAAAFLAGFSLNLAATQGGRLYTFAEVAGWAAAAGLAGIERRPLDAPGTDELLVARRAT
ncbi:methyltransferase family protein [Nonomuraea polychroma]|uniref:Methyltransferase family protein n=1 Tax=Nonomuraea polychroma TaxID=46176 RepID=A0A438LXV1_9ACTN|nr:methyltransferase [Nonomuraea polychroma]RVX38098.1 methyltransferase family protein [Nonomuraea polychroma]